MPRKRKEFFWNPWGYTKKDFKKWGKEGGRPAKYANEAERWRAYRRRKAQKRIDKGEIVGILNIKTGRINKYRNNAERQKAYRERKRK